MEERPIPNQVIESVNFSICILNRIIQWRL